MEDSIFARERAGQVPYETNLCEARCGRSLRALQLRLKEFPGVAAFAAADVFEGALGGGTAGRSLGSGGVALVNRGRLAVASVAGSGPRHKAGFLEKRLTIGERGPTIDDMKLAIIKTSLIIFTIKLANNSGKFTIDTMNCIIKNIFFAIDERMLTMNEIKPTIDKIKRPVKSSRHGIPGCKHINHMRLWVWHSSQDAKRKYRTLRTI